MDTAGSLLKANIQIIKERGSEIRLIKKPKIVEKTYLKQN